MDATPEPFGDRPAPRAFATGYKAHSADMMVYGGGAMTVLGVLAAVLNGAPGFLVLSLIGTLSAFHYAPLLETQVPQLGANADGLYLARIGVMRWEAIAGLTVERRSIRSVRLATLVVELDRPLAEAVVLPEPVPLLRRLTARLARVRGRTIRVDLHGLGMSPDVIEARLLAFRDAAG
jgi:hypothetical protein